MLERTSRFVLEVLPYLLTVVLAAIVGPQALYSQTHDSQIRYTEAHSSDAHLQGQRTKAVINSMASGREYGPAIRRDHAAPEDWTLLD